MCGVCFAILCCAMLCTQPIFVEAHYVCVHLLKKMIGDVVVVRVCVHAMHGGRCVGDEVCMPAP